MKPILLIAEGDAELRDVCREFLAERGYGVETAAAGLRCRREQAERGGPTWILPLAWIRSSGAQECPNC